MLKLLARFSSSVSRGITGIQDSGLGALLAYNNLSKLPEWKQLLF